MASIVVRTIDLLPLSYFTFRSHESGLIASTHFSTFLFTQMFPEACLDRLPQSPKIRARASKKNQSNGNLGINLPPCTKVVIDFWHRASNSQKQIVTVSHL
jgi:hypothetical protein